MHATRVDCHLDLSPTLLPPLLSLHQSQDSFLKEKLNYISLDMELGYIWGQTPVASSVLSQFCSCPSPRSQTDLQVLGACQNLSHLEVFRPAAFSARKASFLSLSIAGFFSSLHLNLNFPSLSSLLREGSLYLLHPKLIASFFLRINRAGCCLICLSVYFIHLLQNYLWVSCYVPDFVLGAGEMAVKKKD